MYTFCVSEMRSIFNDCANPHAGLGHRCSPMLYKSLLTSMTSVYKEEKNKWGLLGVNTSCSFAFVLIYYAIW